MADVILSYKSDEKGRAGFVMASLEAAGFDVWWDQKLSIGQSYDTQIVSKIENAGCVVVLWSKASVASDWVRGEAKLALEDDKLVPLLLDSVRVPPPFNMRHSIDLQAWRGAPSDEQWTNVIKAVRSLVDPSGKSAVLLDEYANKFLSKSGHLIHKIKAKDSTGKWAYYFLLVMPDREKSFMEALNGDGMIDLNDYGSTIASSYGETPSEDVRKYLKARYDFEVL